MWNHRLVRHTADDGASWLSVHEIFYNDDFEVLAYNALPCEIKGEDEREVLNFLELIRFDISRGHISQTKSPSKNGGIIDGFTTKKADWSVVSAGKRKGHTNAKNV